LEWDLKETRKQQYIRSWSKVGGLKDEEKWSDIQDDILNRMVRLERAFREHIAALT